MVKPNPQHDYYRDLEVTPTADQDEIKKQYFKLARLYHPDRNPGKVDEYTPKFQAIQEAHEVLSDPTAKAKYDTDRARVRNTLNAFKANVGTARQRSSYNPGREPTAQRTQAQPKGPPPGPGPGPGPGSKPSNGANRFAAFRGAPAPQPSGVPTDAASKQSAWARMGGAARPGGPDKSRDSDTDLPRKAATAGGPPPRPGAFGRANTTRPPPVTTKSGFDPRATGGQFEPAVTGAANYFTQTRFSDRAAPTAAKTDFRPPSEASDAGGIRVHPAQPAKASRARSGSNVAFTEGEERIAAPYRKSGGERVRINTDGLNRSASVKDAPAHAKAAENNFSPKSSTSSRHRSVSPQRHRTFPEQRAQEMSGFTHMGAHAAKEKMRASDPRRFFDIGGQSSSDSDEADIRSPNSASAGPMPPYSQPPSRGSPSFTERPKAHPRPPYSRAGSHQQWQSGPHKGSGPTTPSVEGNGGTAGATPMYGTPLSFYPPDPQKQKSHTLESIWSAGVLRGHIPSHPSFQALQPLTAMAARTLRHSWSRRANLESESPDTADVAGAAPLFSAYASGGRPHLSQETSFTVPPNNPALRSPRFGEYRSRSEENINTKFSPEGMNGLFKGGDGYFAGMPVQPPDSRQRRSPRGRQGPRVASEVKSQPTSATSAHPQDVLPGLGAMPPPPPMPASMMSRQAAPIFPPRPADAKFSDEEWAKQFKDASWVYQHGAGGSPSKPGSTTASRKGSASSSTSRTRQGSKAGAAGRHPKPATVSESQAEDAGSTTGYDGEESATSRNSDAMDIDDEPETNGAVPGRTPRVRNVSQQPQRADWRDKTAQEATSPATSAGTPGVTPMTLDGFTKVAPFGIDPGAPGDGLGNLNDLGTGLPIVPTASASHPLKSSEPRTFKLPPMPKAPDSPPGRLTVAGWESYVAAFGKYMRAWFGVQKEMQSHFEVRRRELNNMMINATAKPGGMDAWLNTFGEARDEIGLATYLRTLQEDERVREHYNVLCDYHRQAVEDFSAVKDRVLQNGMDG